MIVTVKNDSGLSQQIKVGFSWTSFFFGPFPFLFRGMASQFFLWFFIGMFTLGISNIYLWFAINKLTAKHYMERGYKPIGDGWNIASVKWGISV